MKICFCLLAALGLSQIANAQTSPVPASNSWLSSRGVLSVDEISALVGTPFSPADRARLGTVVRARNVELERQNAKLTAELSEILQQNDAQIAVRIEEKSTQSAEVARLERMKRLQPSRYQELMRRKRAGEKASPK